MDYHDRMGLGSGASREPGLTLIGTCSDVSSRAHTDMAKRENTLLDLYNIYIVTELHKNGSKQRMRKRRSEPKKY